MVKRICVVGAGLMGWQIGLMCARAGYAVRQTDVRPEALENARARQRATLEEWNAKGELGRLKATGEPTEAVMDRITYLTSLEEAAGEADFAIEAATERLEVKRRIFAELGRIARPDAILATNSSSITSRHLADVVSNPGRLCNFHFCNHPWLRPYVETMTCGQTTEDVLETCHRVGKSLGIASAMVHGEVQGFIHNYVWRHVKKAAMTLVDGGHASVEDVDRAVMIGLRCPLGPFQMMDRAGLDVMLDIERQWYAESGDPRDEPPKVLEELVARGDLGVKTGRGFYTYPNPTFERPGWLFGQDEE
ncbi:MAG TPA: 3-hydroxyacyl-CoA dehydrogenase family protein [Chloroflexota bacterium]|jgi:3-hydroxybutyryl-CoA dehydrogenase|nr:3-hydroxyacyl-CoA dehydrogenase family protein [Chloroflexota bacterium]